jgi:hypothetical protein
MAALPQPSRLPDPKDRRETEAWLERRSEQLADSIARSLKKVVTSAYDKFLATLPETSIVSSLTAAGDFHAFDSIVGQWKLIYDKEIAPEIEETYLSGAMSAFTQAPGTEALSDAEVASWARVTNDQAVSYMATTSNRLAGVGDTIWSDVRERVTKAVASGKSNEELKDEIGKLGDFSEYRADTIARTETIGAYVNGDWNGAQALGEFGPAEKVWVATGDARGREWHSSLTNTTLPINEPFSVGGEPMLYPHSPGASARNAVNCRCYVEFLYPGDTRPDGTVISEQAAETQDPFIAPVEAVPVAQAPAVLNTEFVSGEWTTVKTDIGSISRLAKHWAGDGKDMSSVLKRSSFSNYAQNAERIVVNGDVVIMARAGTSDEAFKLLVETVDQMRVLNPSAGDNVLVSVERLRDRVLGECELANFTFDSQMIRLDQAGLEVTDLLADNNWKQNTVPIQQREWTIIHEWGHATDPDNLPGAPKNTIFSKWKNKPPGEGLSEYGSTDKWEGYAESFADWVSSRGLSPNPATQAYAKRYGWKHL